MGPVRLGGLVGGGAARAAPVSAGAWRWLLAVSAAIVAVYTVLRLTGPPQSLVAWLLYLLVVVLGLASVAVGVVSYRPACPVAWWLLAAGYVVSLAGEARGHLLPWVASPWVKDAGFLVSYTLFILGFLLMARARIASRRSGEAVLDSLIVTVAFVLLCCRFLIFPMVLGPYLANSAVPAAAHSAAIVYLVADSLLLGVAVLMVAGGSLHPVTVALILGGVALMLVDDTVSTAMTMAGTKTLAVGWLFSYAFGGAAALHPSMRALTEPARVDPPRLGLLRVGLLVAVSTLTPLLLNVHAPLQPAALTGFLVVGVAVLALLVFARIGGLARAMATQVRRYERLLDLSVRAGEQERLQVAADLHNGPIQRLAAIELAAELARRRLAKGNRAGAGQVLAELASDLGEEVAELRRVMVELRPPVLDELGLGGALAAYAAEFQRRTGIRCTVQLDLAGPLGPARETILYRVVVEVLTNVAKHAKARHAWISVVADGGTAELTVRDDGAGFDPATLSTLVGQSHFGLVGVRDRVELAGGEFAISSRAGVGTTISASLPLPSGSDPQVDPDQGGDG